MSLSSPQRSETEPLDFFSKWPTAWTACGIGIGILLLSFVGILSRPGGDLASFWPANAFLLGLMVRFSSLQRTSTWVAAGLGFFMADALTGSGLLKNMLLNASNLLAVYAGLKVARRFDASLLRLHSPMSVLYMLLVLLAASLTAGATGLFTNPLLFNDSAISGFTAWFATEMANYIAFVPVILSLPDRMERRLAEWMRAHLNWHKALPLLALFMSLLLGHEVGGVGAIAFPVPALMWCAVSYSLLSTTLITFFVSTWTLVVIALSMELSAGNYIARELLLSVRLGVSLVMLTPIMIGSLMRAHQSMVERLRALADRDPLTQVSTRRAFLEAAQVELAALQHHQQPCAVLMLDIDFFKRVNDEYGHAVGDCVLQQFGAVLRECLRKQDVIGRMGGEEFAVLLPHASLDEAQSVAERVREHFAAQEIATGAVQKPPLQCTVSMGLAHESVSTLDIAQFLLQADQALYRAKAQGRNRVAIFTSAAGAEPSGVLAISS